MAAPAGKTGRPILKIVAVVVGFVALLGLAGVGVRIYMIGHRAKIEAVEIEPGYSGKKITMDLGPDSGAGSTASGGASADSNNAAPQKQNVGGAAPPPDSGSAIQPAGPHPGSSAPSPAAAPTPGVVTTGEPKEWALKYQRLEGGSEADLVVRTGDINNLGFGWPQGLDPFSGKETPTHAFPWRPPDDAPAGTDRIMLGSAVTAKDQDTISGDGYSRLSHRPDNLPQPVTLNVGDLPTQVKAIVFQIFLDDFQAPVMHSHFQVSLNGTRIPSFEQAVNSILQTGPIGELVTLELLPEYWPILRTGTVKLLIDDPSTHAPDGYAIDFVRILVNPHAFKYVVSVQGSVADSVTHRPIPGATISAALVKAIAGPQGRFALNGVPAGLVVVKASATGYDDGVDTRDLESGRKGRIDFQLKKHRETALDLERAIDKTGSVAIYGIHFDVGKATFLPNSIPALEAVLELINSKPGSRWIIAGHTDNHSGADFNQKLSEARAASVVKWLSDHGVAADRLVPEGFGLSQPVADNATASGRALNRRVEIAPVT